MPRASSPRRSAAPCRPPSARRFRPAGRWPRRSSTALGAFDGQVLVILDQFEELFVYQPGLRVEAPVPAVLVDAAGDPRSRGELPHRAARGRSRGPPSLQGTPSRALREPDQAGALVASGRARRDREAARALRPARSGGGAGDGGGTARGERARPGTDRASAAGSGGDRERGRSGRRSGSGGSAVPPARPSASLGGGTRQGVERAASFHARGARRRRGDRAGPPPRRAHRARAGAAVVGVEDVQPPRHAVRDEDRARRR